MSDNCKHKLVVKSTLDNMIDILGIADDNTGVPPVSDEERATVKLQLLYAQVLAKDITEIKKYNNEWSNEEIMEQLLNNCSENVKCLTKEILGDDRFRLNISDILKDFNKKY